MSDPEVPVLERFSLAGKVALVSGASSGLGAGFAVALAQAGADVVLDSLAGFPAWYQTVRQAD